MPKTKVHLKKSIYKISSSYTESTQVDLSYKDLKDQEYKILFKNQQTSIVHLNLSYNMLSLQTLPRSNSTWLNLEDLNLNHNYIRSKGVKLFSKVQIPSLKVCSLNHNYLNDEVIRYLIRSKWINLKTLNLSQNSITDAGVTQLLKGNWPSLRSLFLHQNELTNKGIQKLTNSVWKELTILYLYSEKKAQWKSDDKNVDEVVELEIMLHQSHGKLERILL